MSSMKELRALGAFVSDKPVQKEIKFTLEGEELSATIFIKRIAIDEYEALFVRPDINEPSRMAKTISEAVTLSDGKERITFADAKRLHPSIAAAMLEAFNEVNVTKKPSPPAKGSSAT